MLTCQKTYDLLIIVILSMYQLSHVVTVSCDKVIPNGVKLMSTQTLFMNFHGMNW
jgi:hypothetical protein